jgi:PAS domain S-box-containing protein
MNHPMTQKTELLLTSVITALTGCVLVIDLYLPRGISVWVLYMIPLLLTARSQHRHLSVLFASACTGLIIVGFVFSPPLVPTTVSLANRTFGILVLWIITILLLKYKRAEHAVCESETRFRQMAETVQEAFWIATPDVTTTTYISPAYELIWGRSRESLSSNPTSWLDAIHPEDRERVLAALDHYRNGEAEMQYRIVRPDGSIRWIWDHGCPIRNDRGEVSSIVGFAMDITARKLAEEAMKESENRLALVLEASSEGIYDWNIKTGAVYYSPRWVESLGYTAEEVPPDVSFWESIVHPHDMPLVQEKLRAHLEGRTPVFEHENRLQTKSGSWRWTLDRGKVVEWDSDGKPVRMVGADTDITQRKTIQQRQALQHAITRTLAESDSLADSVPKIIRQVCEILEWEMGALWLVDDDADLLRCNKLCWAPAANAPVFETLSRQTSFSRGVGLLGRVWASGRAEWIQDVLEDPEFVRAAAASQDSLHGALAFPITWESRILGVLEFFSRERRTPEQDLLEFLGTIGIQIGQFMIRKQTEEALKESETRFRRLVDANIIGITVTDFSGRILNANRAFLDMVGYTQEEMLVGKMRWDHMTPPEWRPLSEKARTDLLRYGAATPWEKEYLRKDGSRVPVLIGIALTERPSGTCICFVLDLTKRKQAQEALRRTANELADLYHNAPCGYHSLDNDGRFVSVNDTELAWLGYTREELVGKRAFAELLTEDSKKVFQIQFSRVKTQGWMRALAFEMVRKDGTMLPVLLNATAITDTNGRYMIGRFTLLDITERKRAEEERERLILQLEDALANVKTLRGLLSICSGCQKVRDDKGSWRDLETYVRNHSEADFRHALCPVCAETLFPGFYKRWGDTH